MKSRLANYPCNSSAFLRLFVHADNVFLDVVVSVQYQVSARTARQVALTVQSSRGGALAATGSHTNTPQPLKEVPSTLA